MDDDDLGQSPAIKSKSAPSKSEFVDGSVFLQWENSLEKLKILNYKAKFIQIRRKKPFTRVHFVIPGKNPSHQFEDFIDVCSWLINEIMKSSDAMKREQYDDPNTTVNKLLLALRQVNFQVSFPVQKLKIPHGEIVCNIINYLTDQALEVKGFKWGRPDYSSFNQADQAEDLDDVDDAGIEESMGFADESPDQDDLYQNQDNRDKNYNYNDNDLSNQATLLHGMIDANEWKIELERVAPKLKSHQLRSNSEWRSHIVQVLDSTNSIEKVVNNTKSDIASTMRNVTEEINRLQSRENYLNSQFPNVSHQFKDIKVQLDEFNSKSKNTNESLTKLTNELSEITEKIDEFKDIFESKDSGINDTSPLVRIKSALQQIKSEISQFDLKIGVVSHSLMTAKHTAIKTTRAHTMSKNRQKNKKGTKRENSLENSQVFDDE